MFIRWKWRPLKRRSLWALEVVLVESYWTARGARQRVHHLATIWEDYCTAPAHRLAFWQGVTPRLERHVPDPLRRQRLIDTLVQRVPPVTAEEQAQVAAWQAALAQFGLREPPQVSRAERRDTV